MNFRRASSVLVGALIALGTALTHAEDGKATYESKCGACHARNQFGMRSLFARDGRPRDSNASRQALLPQRPGLTEALIRSVARNGLRNMPPLSRVEVTDEELSAIADFLTKSSLENGER